MATIDEINNALKKVYDPELNRNVVELGMIRDLTVSPDGKVEFTLAFTVKGCPMRDQITRSARAMVEVLPGVRELVITESAMTEEERKAVWAGMQTQTPKLSQFSQIKHVIAVMSGKGGVGKSSVTALLACTLARQGFKVGILDADITGPSIPRLFGLPSGGVEGGEMGLLPAITGLGLRAMSMNLLVKEENSPVVWRGPMISAVIKQFWTDVIWGKLDYLIVDMPPGTSDAALTVIKTLPLDGVVLVTTPQDLATMVVRKAVSMLAQLEVNILGLVENMSYFTCPETGLKHAIFGPSHAGQIAAETGIPAWTCLQIVPELAAAADSGQIEQIQLPEMDELVRQLISQPAGQPAKKLGQPA